LTTCRICGRALRQGTSLCARGAELRAAKMAAEAMAGHSDRPDQA
jgi:hypothetical protein